jgi:hypothetical protein
MLPKWCGCAKISCFLENHVPHINAPAEFNQDTLESTRECPNRMQRKQRARQRIESAGPFETPQERNNHLCRECRTVQQATTRARPFLGNDTLQLFGKEDTSASTQWDCGEMDTICGFCNAKMWMKE